MSVSNKSVRTLQHDDSMEWPFLRLPFNNTFLLLRIMDTLKHGHVRVQQKR
jgi:hypothetical protein